jgi:hypothetical protein
MHGQLPPHAATAQNDADHEYRMAEAASDLHGTVDHVGDGVHRVSTIIYRTVGASVSYHH